MKDQADRCIWMGYGAKQAARDALLFQTDDIKLQRKIIAEDLDYDSVIKYGLAFEQGNKKVHTMRAQKEGPEGGQGEEAGGQEGQEGVQDLHKAARRKVSSTAIYLLCVQ